MDSSLRRFRRSGATLWLALLAAALYAGTATIGGDLPGPLPLFPADNWWNVDISSAPVDPGSAGFVGYINGAGVRAMHPDFSGVLSADGVEIGGFPYIVVDGDQPRKAVEFLYGDESDGVDHATGRSYPFYPIPDEAITQRHWIEGGQPGNQDLRSQADRHMLIVDRDNRHLFELYNVFHDGSKWLAGSGAFFDLTKNDRRPDTWTSSDAAGLAILPGLVRYAEVFGPEEIRHAFRVTVRRTNGFVFPASHRAGNTAGALPMGARLRMKASVEISGFAPEIQKIFRAMKRYGLIVADNGTDMYVSGAFDERWNNGVLNPAFHSLNAAHFEVITLGYQPPSSDPQRRVYFSHVVAGGGFSNSFTLVNTGAATAVGRLVLRGQDGSPMEVLPGGLAAVSEMPFTLAPGATWRLGTREIPPESPTAAGWGWVESTGGLVNGVATFLLAAGGSLQSAAGVFGSPLTDEATVPVDNDEAVERFTGFAVANPGAEDLRIRISVRDQNGKPAFDVQPAEVNPLRAGQQVAMFVHQLLPAAATFRGSMRLTAEGGSFAAVALLQDRGRYSALPLESAHE
jgi:hypothetical protein